MTSDGKELLAALEAETLSPAGKKAVERFRAALNRSPGNPRVNVTESQVRAELAKGKSIPQVAEILGVAVNTVRRRLGQKA